MLLPQSCLTLIVMALPGVTGEECADREWISRDNERVVPESWELVAFENGSVEVHAVQGGETIGLRYVRELLSPTEARTAIELCDGRSGWTASPSRENDVSEIMASRTSWSCPLIWPHLYLEHRGRLTAAVDREIDFAWNLTLRAAGFLGVDKNRIEPLQIVRYTPGQFYRQHHDHGAYYGKTTEHRSHTILVFLTSVSPGFGGHTSFPDLGIKVVPRAGDALLWENVDVDGSPLLDAVHEALPPREGRKVAMNLWVADHPIHLGGVAAQAAYRT